MDQTSPELANALLQWINTFLRTPIQTWSSLSDGSQIWGILRDIDSDCFHAKLPEVDGKGTDNWIPRWQNWRIIEKEVTQFIREECGKLPQLSRMMNADLKAIATDASTKDILKIVKCVLLAAMYSPTSNDRMVELMQSLGWKVAQPIATFFGEMEELNDNTEADYGETEPSSEVDYSSEGELPEKSSYKRDPELEREEQLIRVLQDKKKLEARLADALSELEEANERCTALEDEVAESKYALDRRRGKSIEGKDLAQLNQRADRDKEYIDELESDLANARSTIDQQERQLEKFKADAKSKQELKDELQLISADRDELRQKTKANENLKKKIQALQEQEKVNQSLHHDIQAMQDQIQEVESLRDRCAALEKANEENAQTIANGEQEIFDSKTARRMLDHELKLVTQKWEQSKELLINAQETIRDLEERLGESTHDESQGKGFENLDDELNAEAGTVINKDLPKRPKQSVSAADSVALQQNLSIANASVNRLQHRCLDLLQENLGFKAVIDNANEESSRQDLHPFEHQSRKMEELLKTLEESKSRCVSLLNQLTDIKQRTGQDVSLDIRERQTYLEDLEGELREDRGLLRHALLGTDALQRIEPKIRASNEFKLVTQQLQRVQAAPMTETTQVIKAIATNLTDRIESTRGSLAEKTKMLSDKSTEYDELQSRYEAIKSKPPSLPPKDIAPITDKAMKQQLDQLLRENKLMTSAWYDITCRLQSNTVHLARRAENGRSWLGRMRTAVNRQGSKG